MLRLASLDQKEEGFIHEPIKPAKVEEKVIVKETKTSEEKKPVEVKKAPEVVSTPAPTTPIAKPAEPEKKVAPIAPAPQVKVEVPAAEVKVEPQKAISPQKPDETTPPDFLFEDDHPIEKAPEAPKPVKKEATPVPVKKEEPLPETEHPTTTINIANILKPAIATEGMEFELPDEEIVKIMVLADKSERTSLASRWHHFSDLRGDPKIGALASLLADGHPFCICPDAIILSYNFTKRKKEANIMRCRGELDLNISVSLLLEHLANYLTKE